MLSVPHRRIFTKNLMTNPAKLRRSWYMLFFQLPWLPELILRRRDWALLVRVLQNTSPPGVFSDSDLERYKESWARKDALVILYVVFWAWHSQGAGKLTQPEIDRYLAILEK